MLYMLYMYMYMLYVYVYIIVDVDLLQVGAPSRSLAGQDSRRA